MPSFHLSYEHSGSPRSMAQSLKSLIFASSNTITSFSASVFCLEAGHLSLLVL